MAKRIRFCPKCMNIIRKNDSKCSVCGMSVDKMYEEAEKAELAKIEKTKKIVESEKAKEDSVIDNGNEIIVDTAKIIKETSSEKEKQEEKKDEEISADKSSVFGDSNFSTQEDFQSEDVGKIVFESEQNKPKRHKHKSKKKKQEEPQFTVDEDGAYDIDTTDVTYLEGIENPTTSVRKARGELKEEKLKWWEIYKWADRMLAKRKIMKEVNKASHKTPRGISRSLMITYTILLGWLGIQNFYAGNKKKGWVSVVCVTTAVIVVNVPVLYEFCGIFIGGGCGFVALWIWISDLISILLNKFKYKISKEEFISNLNVKTRAKLGKKYIDLDRAVFKAKEEARLNKKNRKRIKKQERANKRMQKLKEKEENGKK